MTQVLGYIRSCLEIHRDSYQLPTEDGFKNMLSKIAHLSFCWSIQDKRSSQLTRLKTLHVYFKSSLKIDAGNHIEGIIWCSQILYVTLKQMMLFLYATQQAAKVKIRSGRARKLLKLIFMISTAGYYFPVCQWCSCHLVGATWKNPKHFLPVVFPARKVENKLIGCAKSLSFITCCSFIFSSYLSFLL